MSFEPKFQVVDTLHDVALLINDPHIDVTSYEGKFLVTRTENVIEMCLDESRGYANRGMAPYDIRSIHSVVFSEYYKFRPGLLRNLPAYTISRDTSAQVDFAEPFQLAFLLDSITPVTKDSDLIQWYKKFQEIHPFTDGNGRVGGVVVAVLHKMKTGEWLAPLQ